jgi:hypothetical protein
MESPRSLDVRHRSAGMNYRVLVDDNFHFMDKSERYELGLYATLETAIEAAREVVDSFLESEYRSGMTASQLYQLYVTFGEDPFIQAPEQIRAPFSAWDYARQRCEDLCGLGADSHS